ncbi:MAG: pyruvate kinase [Patescibacteria group bacterium]|nr:pyruvate kinase [Patescibacteria group bacterium]
MRLRKTKIICTIGPASWDKLEQLMQNGMDLARLNFSHGTHEEKKEQIVNIRKLSQKLNKHVAVIADLQGPKLRLGTFEGEKSITQGEIVHLALNPVAGEIPIQFDLSTYVKKGQRIFLNDGLVELKVSKLKGKIIEAVAQNNGWVAANKGVNIPDTSLGKDTFTEKDYADAEFALKEGVDFLAMSFVQRAQDLDALKDLIKKHKSKAKVIAKIEKKEAAENLKDIILASDGVMVARGDLAIETSAAKVPILQQEIISLARQLRKPVIIATQMLESMVGNPRPTRAEASDVAYAVFNQVDAVMLSAESAIGKYPVEAAATMQDIIFSVEENPDLVHSLNIGWENLDKEELQLNALVSSAASLARNIQSPLIAAATETGKTARYVSAFRPNAVIVAAVADETIRNQLMLIWGVHPLIVELSPSSDIYLKRIIETIKKKRLAEKGSKIVMITGSITGVSGATDTVKIGRICGI